MSATDSRANHSTRWHHVKVSSSVGEEKYRISTSTTRESVGSGGQGW